MPHRDLLGNFYTIDEVASALQKNPSTILRWIMDGQLPADQIGKRYRIRPADLAAFAASPNATRDTRRISIIRKAEAQRTWLIRRCERGLRSRGTR